MELWTSSEPDVRNSNKMISGFADLFTQEDVKALDRWLTKRVADPSFQDTQSYSGNCQVQLTPQSGGFDLQVMCPVKSDANLALQSGVFVVRNGNIQQGVVDNLFLYPGDGSCNRSAPQTVQNRVSGIACPALLHAEAAGALQGDILQIQMHRSNGVNARLIDGRLLSTVVLNVKTGQWSMKVFNDMGVLDQAIAQIQFLDPFSKKTANTPFNRKYILKSFAQLFGVTFSDPDTDGKMPTLDKNLDVNPVSEQDILGQIKNPVDGFSHSCSMCHYNFEGVPPAFLGLKQNSIDKLGKCARIEICAPRMLYRLKMRNCSADRIEQFQKSPMPMQQFFTASHVDMGVWQQKVAPTLITFAAKLVRPQELSQYLVSQGLDAAKAQASVSELLTKSCPNVDYSTYESLPRCEFSHLRADSPCPGLMKSYESN